MRDIARILPKFCQEEGRPAGWIRNRLTALAILVGVRGFEPPTTCTPYSGPNTHKPLSRQHYMRCGWHAKRCIWVRFVSMACTAVLPMAVHAELDLSLPPSFVDAAPLSTQHETRETPSWQWTWRQSRIVATAALTADWLQTRYIATHDDYRERNPIVGHDPDMARANAVVLGSMAAYWVIGELIPPQYRDWYWGGIASAEVMAVGYNASIGIGFQF